MENYQNNEQNNNTMFNQHPDFYNMDSQEVQTSNTMGGYESRELYNRINTASGSNIKKKRILAFFLDNAILGLINIVIFFIFIFSKTEEMNEVILLYGQEAVFKEFFGGYLIALFLGTFFFVLNSVILPAFVLHGQTIGKKIVKIRTVKKDDVSQTPGAGVFFLRETFGKLISSLFFIGYIFFLVSKENKTFHDVIFKTTVVDDEY